MSTEGVFAPVARISALLSNRGLDLALLSLGGLIALASNVVLGPLLYPITDDGVTYIESARNLGAGKGLVHSPFSVEPVDAELVPLKAFPPGYPLLIALIATLGVEEHTAALLISRASVALIPFLTNWALRPVVPLGIRVGAGVLAGTSPGVIEVGFYALTDVPYLCLSLLCVGALLRGKTTTEAAAWLLVSGAAAGACYAVRIFGVALILAGGATVLLRGLLRTRGSVPALEVSAWAGGALVAIIPLWYRNLALFGNLQAYGAPQLSPAAGDWVFEFREHLWNVLVDSSGATSAGMLAWDWKLAVVAVAIAASLGVLALPRAKQVLAGDAEMLLAVFGLLYLGIGTAIVVYGQAVYAVSDYLRYAIPHSWILIVGLFCVLAAACGTSERRKRLVLLGAFVALLGSRIAHLEQFVANEAAVKRALETQPSLGSALKELGGAPNAHVRRQLVRFHASNPEVPEALTGLPEQALLVSNYGHRLNLVTPIATRRIEGDVLAGNGLFSRILEACRAVRARDLIVLLLPDQSLLRRWGDDWRTGVIERLPPRFVILRQSETLLLVEFDRCASERAAKMAPPTRLAQRPFFRQR